MAGNPFEDFFWGFRSLRVPGCCLTVVFLFLHFGSPNTGKGVFADF